MRKHLKFGLSACFSGVLVELNTRVDILVLGFSWEIKRLVYIVLGR